MKPDYSGLWIAELALRAAGIATPTWSLHYDEAVRRQAYELMLEKDFLIAQSIRLGRHYEDFTDEEWRQIILYVGAEKVECNTPALRICVKRGIVPHDVVLEESNKEDEAVWQFMYG